MDGMSDAERITNGVYPGLLQPHEPQRQSILRGAMVGMVAGGWTGLMIVVGRLLT
jgi:hypothetical protein